MTARTDTWAVSPAVRDAVREGATVFAHVNDGWAVVSPIAHAAGDIVSVALRGGEAVDITIAARLAVHKGRGWVGHIHSYEPTDDYHPDPRWGMCENHNCSSRYPSIRSRRGDMSGISGWVCTRCAGAPTYDLTFA